MTDRLISWTRTLNEEEAAFLLDEARPGESVAAWAERAHATLPQGSRDRRTELIRLVRDQLLDKDDAGLIADSAYLPLSHADHPKQTA